MRLLLTGGSGFIGTNVVDSATTNGIEVFNVDTAPPLNPDHGSVWTRCDILDEKYLIEIFRTLCPTHVVHLAARTDTTTGDPIEAYPQNTLGTRKVLDAIGLTESVERVIITSTQFVCAPGYEPARIDDYNPHTIYGETKVITEDLTRKSGIRATWTIIRPTTVWGPWCLRYRDGFFRALRRGLYAHPGRQPCVRSYGYVGNVVHQIFRILESPPENVSGATLYVGDIPINLLDWVDGFSRELVGKPVRIAPRPLIRILAIFGDLISSVRRKEFAITSSRYHSMTQDYITDMDTTESLLGPSPFSMSAGIRETVRWLRKWEEQNCR